MKTSQGLVAVFVLCLAANCLDAQGPALVAEEEIADNINKGAFTAVVIDVAKTVSPFLNAFTSVVKFLFGIRSTPTESPEMKYLRNLSESINRKFDQVNTQFTEVKNLIDWRAVQVSYGTYERNIRAVSDHLNYTFLVPASSMNQQMQLFAMNYENGYDGSGSKLFTAFIQDHGVISQGLLRPAMKYTRNDRGKMRTFMLGILKLLMMAAKVELAYLGVKDGYDSLIPFYIHQWQVRIEQVQEKMKAIDLELKNGYLRDSLNDIDRFTSNSTNLQLSNINFGRDLYKELSSKYFWRDWLVIVSTHTEGHHDAHSRVCHGIMKQVKRKDLVIDSVERDKPSFNMKEIEGLYASLQQTCHNTATYIPCVTYPNCNYPYATCTKFPQTCYYNYGIGCPGRMRRCGSYENSENADTIFNWFGIVKTSCSTYTSVGIIANNRYPVYFASPTEGSSNRLMVYDLGLCDYKVHFFG